MLSEKYCKRIDEIVSESVDKGEFAGVACAVMKDGEMLYKNAWGKADIERNIDMRENSIFRVHSFSKVITACAVMKLLEEGRIDLNYPVEWFLSGFKNQHVIRNGELIPVNSPVTIKDLLNMTSGCVYPEAGEAGERMGTLFWQAEQAYLSGKPFSTVELCNKIGEQPLMFQPGEQWHYGTSADVLGAIVEIITGKPYDEYLREEIFEPLGMNDTGFYVPADKMNRFTQIYDYPQGKPVPFEQSFLGLYSYEKRPAFISGGAGVVSTVLDSVRLAAMLSNDGELDGVRILSPKTVEFMARDNLTEAQKTEYKTWTQCRGYGYGNLCRVHTDPSMSSSLAPLGEFGWDGWAGAYASCNRTDRLAYTIFVQRCGAGTTDISRRVKNVILSSL